MPLPPEIDGFTGLAEVGRGGFGTVYRAHQQEPAREVAVKVLPDVRADSDAYGRFTREYRALAAVGGHPNIARVHACGVTADGSGYLALELLTGGSLGDRLRAGGGAPWVEVATWGVQLSGALETAHRAGITHRDIKPENVLFDAAGTPKLVDFGIAGVPGAYRTATGSVTLTLAHAAPEVVAGGRGGVPGDVYSLASTLYAGVAGTAAFVADADETLVPMLARIATAPVPDLRPRGVPDSVCTVLERGMAKDPADRPASAEALGMSLQAALAREGAPAAAPLLLRSPGVAAPFVVSDSAPSIGATARASSAGEVEGDRTLTGWVAPVPAAAVGQVPAPGSRRRSGMLAAAAGLGAVLALLLVWRGLDAPAPAAAGSGASPSQIRSIPPSTASPSPSPTPSSSTASASPTRTPSAAKSGTPTGGSNLVLAAQPGPSRTSSKARIAPSRSSAVPGPSTTAAPTATPSATSAPAPPPPARPLAPRKVRVDGAVVTPRSPVSGAEVSLRLSWLPAATGPVPSAYEVRYTAVGGATSGTSTLATTISATTVTLVVPTPGAGSRYRWQVRAVLTSQASTWVTARAAVPQLVDRRVALARVSLRALGLRSSTYRIPVTSRASAGRVLEQSLPRGRVVPLGSSIALGIGTVS